MARRRPRVGPCPAGRCNWSDIGAPPCLSTVFHQAGDFSDLLVFASPQALLMRGRATPHTVHRNPCFRLSRFPAALRCVEVSGRRSRTRIHVCSARPRGPAAIFPPSPGGHPRGHHTRELNTRARTRDTHSGVPTLHGPSNESLKGKRVALAPRSVSPPRERPPNSVDEKRRRRWGPSASPRDATRRSKSQAPPLTWPILGTAGPHACCWSVCPLLTSTIADDVAKRISPSGPRPARRILRGHPRGPHKRADGASHLNLEAVLRVKAAGCFDAEATSWNGTQREHSGTTTG